MGIVYQARKISTDTVVALKILSPSLTRQKSRQRFVREAEAAARLTHPHIVAVYDIHSEEDLCYYAMEYVEGWPLSRVIRTLPVSPASLESITQVMETEPLGHGEVDPNARTMTPGHEAEMPTPPDQTGAYQKPAISGQTTTITSHPSYIREVVIMMRDVAQALDYAHTQGIFHRDIKPGNLLLDKEGTLHLVDFGLARVLDEENITISGELMGTPMYMSPEQVAAGRIGMDHRTDIYSLGVVMYHLLCLQPPYEGQTREALLRSIAVQDPPLLSSVNPYIPHDLEAIVHHAIKKDPDQRYATGADFAADLDNWLAGKSIKIKSIGPLRRWWTMQTASTRRTVKAGASIAAISVALFAVLLSVVFKSPIPTPTPLDAESPIAQAIQHADQFDYLTSALWHARAIEEDTGNLEKWALHRSVIFNELPRLHYRFPLGAVRTAFDFHPAKPQLVTGMADQQIQVWDLLNTDPVGDPYRVPLPIKWLSYNQFGDFFLSIMGNPQTDSVQLLKPELKPEELSALPMRIPGMPPIRYIRMASEAGIVAFISDAPEQNITANSNRPIYQVDVYSFQANKLPKRLKSFEVQLPVELSIDGQYLATTLPNGFLSIIDLMNDEEKPTVFEGTPTAICFSPATPEAAIADAEGNIFLFDLATGNPLRWINMPTIRTGQGLRRSVPAYMQYNANGTRLLVVGSEKPRRTVLLWETQLGTQLYRANYRRNARFSDDSQILSIWDDESVRFINVVDGEEINRISPSLRRPMKGADNLPQLEPSNLNRRPVWMDAAGRRVVCIEKIADWENLEPDQASRLSASVWDVITGERIWRLPVFLTEQDMAGLDPSGQFAFACLGPSPQNNELLVWDLRPRAGIPQRTIQLPVEADQMSVTQHPYVVTFVKQQNGKPSWSLIDPVRNKIIGAPVTDDHSNKYWVVSEAQPILFAVNTDGLANAIDLATGEQIEFGALPSQASEVLAISPDGKIVAIAHKTLRVTLYYVKPQEAGVPLSPIDALPDPPTQMRFSRNGAILAIADEQGRISINTIRDDIKSFKVLNTGQPVHHLLFCLDDKLLVAGHQAGRASLWAVDSGQCLARIEPSHRSTGPTLVAVRDRSDINPVPLLAVACANRIQLYPLPSLQQNRQQPSLQSISPPLEATHRIVDLAFLLPNANDPSGLNGLYVVTDQSALRWYDLSILDYSPQQWQQLSIARTAMKLDEQNIPVIVSRNEWLKCYAALKKTP